MSNPRLRQAKTTPAGPEIQKLFRDNAEVLVITINPDGEGESDLAVFQKMADQQSVLAPYLREVLKRLVKTNGPKPRGQPKAPIGA